MNDETSLKERIEKLAEKHDDNPTKDPKAVNNKSALGGAMRTGTELVSGVAVGTFIGYWIDQHFGTSPFAMIVFFFLGFAAGFLNIYKAQTGNYHKTGIGELTNADKNGQKNADKE